MGCVGCTSCGTEKSGGSVGGCNSNGCGSGGCNRLNTFDWLSFMEIPDVEEFHIVEVSFKNGSRKEFFKNQAHNRTVTGDMVVVETGNGYDIGKISLSGDLVRLQMKKKKVSANDVMHFILRKANERDLDRLVEAREIEKSTMVRARVIARTLDLNMKIGDVEYQGDKRKATFYYIADGRVDFRELIRHYAKEFRVKIEMRQIGARQESARIGGIGSCGRELCCSTWLTDFKSVSTAAARYQNLAINQAKLSGMCGRLKCCLNYELDTYLDALENFPKGVDKIKTKKGTAILVKTDIFKGLMFYVYEHERGRGKFYPLDLKRVKQIQRMNKAGELPHDLVDMEAMLEEITIDYGDVTGAVELPAEKRRGKRNRGRRKNKSDDGNRQKPKSSPNDLMSKPINKSKSTSKQEQTTRSKRDDNRSSRNETKKSTRSNSRNDSKRNSRANQKTAPKNGAKEDIKNRNNAAPQEHVNKEKKAASDTKGEQKNPRSRSSRSRGRGKRNSRNNNNRDNNKPTNDNKGGTPPKPNQNDHKSNTKTNTRTTNNRQNTNKETNSNKNDNNKAKNSDKGDK